MPTAQPTRRRKPKVKQLSLFDDRPLPEPKPKRWSPPKPDERGENWAAVFIDPKQLGIEVDETILTRPRRRA
jgi:hypothetical protein